MTLSALPATPPLVTVITPAGPRWNPDHLLAAGRSLLTSVVSLEWLVVCDGADPQDVERTVAAVGLPNFRVLGSTANRGTAAARNTALTVARGRWTYAFDADDLSLGAINRLLSAAIATNTLWAAGRAYDVDETGSNIIYIPDIALSPFTTTIPVNAFLTTADATGIYPFLCSGATIIDTALARALGGWNETLRDVSEDVALIAKLSATAAGGWVDDGFVLAYRKHGASTTAQVRDKSVQNSAWDIVRAGVKQTADRTRTDYEYERIDHPTA
jgi:glycosyltransferase involved in cell wall biosynthesis